MRTAIITDSNSGITPEKGEKLGVYVVAMPIIVDDVTYYENVDITREAFFAALTSGKNVSSSQPSPASVIDMWEKALAEGYDEILYIPMDSVISGSYGTAVMLAEDYDGKVLVADVKRVSANMRDAVIKAKKLADQGVDAKAIKDKLEAEVSKSVVYIMVDTMEYLKKGGRITPAAAAIGTILNIKPVLSIYEGVLDAWKKVRGVKKAKDTMLKGAHEFIEENFPDVPLNRISIGTAGSLMNEKDAKEWYHTVKKEFPESHTFYNDLSLSLCCHIGPEGMGISVSAMD